ncbi:MAG: hypothetical protein ABIP75_05670 [Pyrinomonadaceae bacterium]
MGRSLSPFTRLTLLMSELKGLPIEDLIDVKKCDLAHHVEHLPEELESDEQKAIAVQISEQGTALLASIHSGNLAGAEGERKTLIATCRKLKDLL